MDSSNIFYNSFFCLRFRNNNVLCCATFFHWRELNSTFSSFCPWSNLVWYPGTKRLENVRPLKYFQTWLAAWLKQTRGSAHFGQTWWHSCSPIATNAPPSSLVISSSTRDFRIWVYFGHAPYGTLRVSFGHILGITLTWTYCHKHCDRIAFTNSTSPCNLSVHSRF